EPVVGHAEDRRLGILVDRDDHLRILHAGQVLDRAADAAGDVQLRRDDLARLPHLPVVGRVARVHGGAAPAPRPPPPVRPGPAPSWRAAGVSPSLNLSLLPMARPPETMILAAVSSGRSLLAISAPTNLDVPASPTAATVSTGAPPPLLAAGSKPVVRTVITL